MTLLLSPVWLLANFHTGDGPSHLYNAYVLKSLLIEPDSFYNNFFQLHLQAVPNAIVPFLLAGCMAFTSSVYATKIVVTIILLVFVTGYSSMARAFLKEENSFPVVILLLVYCYPLRMGLYSFILGLGVMMFVFACYVRNKENWTTKTIFIFSFLFIVTWFSHLFAFAVLLLLIFIYEAVKGCLLISEGQGLKKFGYDAFRKFIALIPAIILLLLFLKESVDVTKTIYIEKAVLKRWLLDLEVMFNFGTDAEFIIRKIFYLLIVGALVLLLLKKGSVRPWALFFLSATMIVHLLFYFLMPANLFSGGSINFRFAYLLLIMVCFTIDLGISYGLPGIVKMLLVGVGVYFATTNEYKMLQPASDDIAELLIASDHIKEKTIVLPLNYLNDNFEYNILLYLAYDKDILILDNAEAATPNGLVTWRKDFWHPELIGDYLVSNTPLIQIQEFERQSGKKIDYVLRWSWKPDIKDTSTLQVNNLVDSLFVPVFKSHSGKATMFLRKGFITNGY